MSGRRARAGVAAFALAATGLGLAACESTQDRSARLEAEGVGAIKTSGLSVAQRNADIEVVERAVLFDQNGAAVALVLKNTSQEGLADAPIAIDVKDAKGKSVFRNDAHGLETSLTHVPIMKPGSEVLWVNDQVLALGKPRTVDVKVGEAKQKLPGELPEIVVSEPVLENDPVSGIEATGTVTNESDVEQNDLVLYAVARKGGKIVAAGRGQILKLKTDGKPVPFHIFFIGNPEGAELTVIAPPVEIE